MATDTNPAVRNPRAHQKPAEDIATDRIDTQQCFADGGELSVVVEKFSASNGTM
jgi:hypothetical protein